MFFMNCNDFGCTSSGTRLEETANGFLVLEYCAQAVPPIAEGTISKMSSKCLRVLETPEWQHLMDYDDDEESIMKKHARRTLAGGPNSRI